jgi:polyphosphate glucokinase
MNERRVPDIVLVVDVGGAHVKVLASNETVRRRFQSGPTLTPREMVDGVLEIARDWEWEVVTVGIPAPVRGGMPIAEPVNLGKGWVGFDFEAAFGKPTKVINDAAMQAVGSYQGGRMLFLGLGTGMGSALIYNGNLEPLELGHLPFRKRTFEDYVSESAMKK